MSNNDANNENWGVISNQSVMRENISPYLLIDDSPKWIIEIPTELEECQMNSLPEVDELSKNYYMTLFKSQINE
jgi:hypothetical protein